MIVKEADGPDKGNQTSPVCERPAYEADGPDKGNQTSPVPERPAYQDPVSGRSTSEHSDSGRSI